MSIDTTSGSINGTFFIAGGIIMSISVGFLVSSLAWGCFGIGVTFVLGSLLAAFS